MDAWHLNVTLEQLAGDAALLGGTLLIATWLRTRVTVFQRYLVPNALVAGLLGLVLGQQLLNVVPVSLERMGAYVYHLLALTFICVGLKRSVASANRGAMHIGFLSILTLLLQGIAGLCLLLLFAWLVDPSASPAAGILLPLGFATGPGVAYSIGQSWSEFGFTEGASVGLTLAAIGFMVAYVVGVWVVHRTGHSSRDLPPSIRTGLRARDEWSPAGKLTLSPEAVEPMAIHLALVAGVYGLTYVAAWGLASGLEAIGRPQEISVVWSFHFILANLLALTARTLLTRIGAGTYLDNGLLDRAAGVMTDFLVAASIMAISLAFAWRYAVPIVLMAAVGSMLTYFALRIAGRWVFADYQDERFLGVFGGQTGTLTSALALVRVLDPEYRTPVAQELVLGSAFALALGFPLLAALSIPFTVYEGRTEGFLVLLGIMTAYITLLIGGWRFYFLRTGKA